MRIVSIIYMSDALEKWQYASNKSQSRYTIYYQRNVDSTGKSNQRGELQNTTDNKGRYGRKGDWQVILSSSTHEEISLRRMMHGNNRLKEI